MSGQDYEKLEIGQIQEFGEKAVTAYDHLGEGEREAKFANVLGYVLGDNVAMVGPPGGLKSTLMQSSHLVVGGIDPEHVASMPTQADLKPERVIGGRVDIERVTNGATETISTDIPAFIKPETKKLEIDEATRMNPHALNTLLELVRTGRVATTAGTLILRDLIMASATLNPAESRQATFQIADAFGSRFPIGVVMGLRDEDVTASIMGGKEPEPGKIEPVISLEDLLLFQQYIASNKVSLDSDIQKLGVYLVHTMNDRLREVGFDEAEGRMAYQLRRLSKGVAALQGRNVVGEGDIHQGAQFIYTARLGMSGLRGSGMKVRDIKTEADALLSA